MRTYLDAAAGAPLHPAAHHALLAALDDGWADARRLHSEGRRARLLLDGAREAVAAVLGTTTSDVTFTGSHVLAVQGALQGLLRARRRVGAGVVTSAVEHSAVLYTARQAGEHRIVRVDHLGRVDAEAFEAQVSAEGVAVACLQSANAEVGTTQPVDRVAEATTRAGVPLLVDAAASLGHAPTPARWDALTGDARSWGGPAGIGVFATRPATRWLPTAPEHDGLERTPGDVSIPAALAAAVALEAVAADRAATDSHRRALVDVVRTAAAALSDTEVAGDPLDRLPHIVTFSCLYADGETLVTDFDRAGFAVGSGSACTASTLLPSHVLTAMGMLSHGNVRLGLPVEVTHDDIARFCEVLPSTVAGVRALLGAEDL